LGLTGGVAAAGDGLELQSTSWRLRARVAMPTGEIARSGRWVDRSREREDSSSSQPRVSF
ncbi:Hypothetical predicted protein, partial [Olea europaea subsp. europaea]